MTAPSNAELRVALAAAKKDLRQAIVERDQARGGIEVTLRDTGAPSLGVLISFYTHYQKVDASHRRLTEKLKLHIEELPIELAEALMQETMRPDANDCAPVEPKVTSLPFVSVDWEDDDPTV